MAGTGRDGADDRTEIVRRVVLDDGDGLDEHRANQYTPALSLGEGEAALVVSRGPTAGSWFLLQGARVELGRGEVAIPLTDHTVSRRHAAIERSGEQFWIEDLGSLNGVYVNDKSVQRAPLAHGDRLQIGLFKLLFFAGRPT